MNKEREDLSMNDILTSIKKDMLKTPYDKFDLKTENFDVKSEDERDLYNPDEEGEIMDLINENDESLDDAPLDLTDELQNETHDNINASASSEYDFTEITKSLSDSMTFTNDPPLKENNKNKNKKKIAKAPSKQNDKIDQFLEMIESSDESLSFNESLISEKTENESLQSIEKIISTKKRIQNEEEKANMMTRTTIEDLALAALTPMLKQWIDTNLNGIVEKVIQREIEKLINKASNK